MPNKIEPLSLTVRAQRENSTRQTFGEYAHIGLIVVAVLAHVVLFLYFAQPWLTIERA